MSIDRGPAPGFAYSRLVHAGGAHVQREPGVPWRGILATLAASTALLVPLACGGSSPTADQRDQQLVGRDAISGLGTGALERVACTGPRCRVATTYPFHSLTEASLVAVPIVFMINSDDLAPRVRAIRLTITNFATDETAEFDCRLNRPTRSGSFNVTSLRRICGTSLVPAA